MANGLDTQSGRRSVHGYGPGWLAPVPDSVISRPDRKHAAGLFAGDLIPALILFGTAVAGPVVQLLLGDSSGRVRAELRPGIEQVTWELSAAGSCDFVVAGATARQHEQALEFGNRVLLRFDNGLPEWGGVLAGTREWREDGSLAITAVGLLAAFGKRLTAAIVTYQEQTAEVILNSLLTTLPNVVSGSLVAGQQTITAQYNFANVLDAMEQLLSVEDWAIEVQGSLFGNTIIGTMNTWTRGTRQRTDAVLMEGHNVGGVVLREEDLIVNTVHVIGSGGGWTTETRAMVTIADSASVAQYGVRETALFEDEIVSVSALEALGNTLLARRRTPRRAVQLTAVNREPGSFERYHVGDTLRVRLFGYGMDGIDEFFEVLGRSYSPQSNACDLVLEQA